MSLTRLVPQYALSLLSQLNFDRYTVNYRRKKPETAAALVIASQEAEALLNSAEGGSLDPCIRTALIKQLGLYYVYYAREEKKACTFLQQYAELNSDDTSLAGAEAAVLLYTAKMIFPDFANAAIEPWSAIIAKLYKLQVRIGQTEDERCRTAILLGVAERYLALAYKRQGKLIEAEVHIKFSIGHLREATLFYPLAIIDLAETKHIHGVIVKDDAKATKDTTQKAERLARADALLAEASADEEKFAALTIPFGEPLGPHWMSFITEQSQMEIHNLKGEFNETIVKAKQSLFGLVAFYNLKQADGTIAPHTETGKSWTFLAEALEGLEQYKEAHEAFQKSDDIKAALGYQADSPVRKFSRDGLKRTAEQLAASAAAAAAPHYGQGHGLTTFDYPTAKAAAKDVAPHFRPVM